MKNKKSVLKKSVGLTLLLSMALNPMTVLASEMPKNEVVATSTEATKLEAYQLEGIDKTTGKKIEKEVSLRVVTHPDWIWDEAEIYTITSKNGIFDFNTIGDKDTVYGVEIIGESDYVISNLKKDEKNYFILKFDRKGNVKTSDMNGGEEILSNLTFESKVKAPIAEKGKGIISDISVVFENEKAVEDGINFLSFNKENKDMADYFTKDGKLSKIKANAGDRMKLGLSPDATEKYILKTENGYENFVWYKADENGTPKLYNEITGKTSDKTLDKLVVVKKSDLIGKIPTDKQKVKKTLKVMDNGTQVTKDTVKFLVMGAGETKEVFSKDGVVELDLYKNTNYTVVLVRTIENPYKMAGFKFSVQADGSLMGEDNKAVENLNVYQGSYLVRLYVIQGGKHVTKSLEFNIEEIGGETQVRKNENKFLNFDAKIGKSYKITLKVEDKEYYLEKALEFTMEKYEEDGLYWPRVPEGDKTQGENRKVKAVWLKRYDGVDNHIIGLDDGSVTPCPECNDKDVCEISKVKVKTLPISVKLPENADKTDVKFKLFNSSKQQYEGEFIVDESGKLPALELFENNSYFLQLVSEKYFMHNIHFEAAGEGKLPLAFKFKRALDEVVVEMNNKDAKNDGTYEMNLKFVKDNKALANEEIQFIGTIHTTKATTDESGHVKVRLMEDVTYVTKPTNQDLIIDIFPLVVKDKSEWGTIGQKYIFDHCSCGNAEVIKVKNRIIGRTEGSITCKPGNTTIKGMDFKDLLLVTDHLDKDNFPQLKGKDYMLLDLVLINHVRQNCERTKLAYGEFEILRKLPADKKVSAVYYLNGNTKEEMKFVQSENIVKITGVNSLGVYPLVIEFENKGLDFPSTPSIPSNPIDTVKPEVKKEKKEEPKKEVKGTWTKEDGVWLYKDENGKSVYSNDWAKIDGVWYRFDENGKMLSNKWFKEDGKWYWIENSGKMSADKWVYVNGEWFWANNSGRIVESQWVWVDGKWYYAKSGGYLAINTTMNIDGTDYRFNASGEWY